MLVATTFGCLDPALTVAAALSSKSPFLVPFGSEDAADLAKGRFKVKSSDFLTIHNAFDGWRKSSAHGTESARSYCRKNFLSHQVSQLSDCCKDDHEMIPFRIYKQLKKSDNSFSGTSSTLPSSMSRKSTYESLASKLIRTAEKNQADIRTLQDTLGEKQNSFYAGTTRARQQLGQPFPTTCSSCCGTVPQDSSHPP